jgi:predicted transcriptional regulator
MARHDTKNGNHVKKVTAFLEREQIATMDELKCALETDAAMTVYRALKRASYRTSYSHNGRYYALSKSVRFNNDGLWSARSVWFSRHGTLLATLEKLVTESERGCFADELESLLRVGVKESLLRLVQRGGVSRERIGRSYLYCSKSESARKRQLVARGAGLLHSPSEVPDEVKAAIVLFAALLDERQLRLFAGIQVLQFGRTAEGWLSELLGVHRKTIAKGRQELLDRNVDFKRVRKKGAGRPRVEKKRPRSSKKSRSS